MATRLSKAAPEGVVASPRRRLRRSHLWVVADSGVWIAATELAVFARFDFDAMNVGWLAATTLAVILAAGQLAIGWRAGLYRGRYQSGSFEEMRAVAATATAVAGFATVIVLILEPEGLPRSAPFIAWPLSVVGMGAIRFSRRIVAHNRRLPPPEADRILIVGAGWMGSALALGMLRDSESPYRPVGFLDDDPAKRSLQLHGLRVLGPVSDMHAVADRVRATRVVIAIFKADANLIRGVSDAATSAGLACSVLPPLSEQLRRTQQLRLSDLRDVDVEDVIGRRPVNTDVAAIAEYIEGRRVLVTGAGGSIGSELCRQLHKFGPSELVMLDRDESGLHAVELSIFGRALLDSANTSLVDIRDEEAILAAFKLYRPEVVFHAAALKHLPLLERHPVEAYKSNVLGTRNVLTAAQAVGVTHFVNVSTDKAANPVSALGHSKRLAERMTAWFACANPGTGKFLSVRFGNVLGSRGSVLHTFAAQIDAGGPVTVTHPEVTRFFMTIAEACQLVIQAGAIGRPGEALVLDMGEPVKIVDVADRMITMSGSDVEIIFTGLRPGEKMHEDLLGDEEAGERRLHPLISHVEVPPIDPADVERAPWVQASVQPPQFPFHPAYEGSVN